MTDGIQSGLGERFVQHITTEQVNDTINNHQLTQGTPWTWRYNHRIYKKGEEYTKRFDPTSIVDLTVSYKINRKKVSHNIAFEGLNILGAKSPQNVRFDLGTLNEHVDKYGISLPNVFYRLDF